MFLEVLQVVTVVLGIATTSFSIVLAYKFYVVKHDLGKHISYDVLAQGIAGLVTVLFSLNSMFNSVSGEDPIFWNTLSPEIAIIFRWVLFLTLMATTLNLFYRVLKISKG
jgi:hypothetical protein